MYPVLVHRLSRLLCASFRPRLAAIEGKLRSRVVVIEFPSYDAALNCYRSPESQKAKALRMGKGVAEIVVLEGYDGAQPTDG